jgi:hypothetical protein
MCLTTSSLVSFPLASRKFFLQLPVAFGQGTRIAISYNVPNENVYRLHTGHRRTTLGTHTSVPEGLLKTSPAEGVTARDTHWFQKQLHAD